MNEALRTAIRRFADAHADAEGFASPAPGIHIVRAFAPTELRHALYRPVLCLVLQGAKQVTAGTEVVELGANRSLIVSVDTPVVSYISGASRTEPFLAFSVDLDIGLMREIASQTALRIEPSDGRDQIAFVHDTEDEVSDCALRLVRLFARPEAVAVLLPGLLKELHYWLLAGPHGSAIGRLTLPDSHAQRIARAIDLLRAGFATAVPVERLAQAAGMSPSSFHQHFRAITSLSPLQFQKQLRLLEARRLMTSEGLAASRAAFAVGYESVPQFTREYARMFGLSPRRDMARTLLTQAGPEAA